MPGIQKTTAILPSDTIEMRKLIIPLILSLTLGLAPFKPEPHILGKIRWIAGGAAGMKPIDWFDTILHGFPWVWLMLAIIAFVIRITKSP